MSQIGDVPRIRRGPAFPVVQARRRNGARASNAPGRTRIRWTSYSCARDAASPQVLTTSSQSLRCARNAVLVADKHSTDKHHTAAAAVPRMSHSPSATIYTAIQRIFLLLLPLCSLCARHRAHRACGSQGHPTVRAQASRSWILLCWNRFLSLVVACSVQLDFAAPTARSRCLLYVAIRAQQRVSMRLTSISRCRLSATTSRGTGRPLSPVSRTVWLMYTYFRNRRSCITPTVPVPRHPSSPANFELVRASASQ